MGPKRGGRRGGRRPAFGVRGRRRAERGGVEAGKDEG